MAYVLRSKPTGRTSCYNPKLQSITAVHFSIFRSSQPAVNVYPSACADSECLPIRLLLDSYLRVSKRCNRLWLCWRL